MITTAHIIIYAVSAFVYCTLGILIAYHKLKSSLKSNVGVNIFIDTIMSTKNAQLLKNKVCNFWTITFVILPITVIVSQVLFPYMIFGHLRKFMFGKSKLEKEAEAESKSMQESSDKKDDFLNKEVRVMPDTNEDVIIEEIKEKKVSIAQRLHDSYEVQEHVDEVIIAAFKKYEPEIYNKLEFHVSSDWYDNSIEIYFDVSLPYPYEPCNEIRQAIYDLGFSIVYWNFNKDTMDVKCDRITPPPPDGIVKNSPDEIRGYEPRHNKFAHWISTEYGYVDERFNEKEWLEKYNFKNCKDV